MLYNDASVINVKEIVYVALTRLSAKPCLTHGTFWVVWKYVAKWIGRWTQDQTVSGSIPTVLNMYRSAGQTSYSTLLWSTQS